MMMEDSRRLKTVLAGLTRAGTLYASMPDGWVRCVACGHRCKIPPGRDGICKVRFNDAGTLRVPFGYVNGFALDPVEKKPFFHVFPGSLAFSFGMLGCDYHCPFCQNWTTSQVLRDPEAIAGAREIGAEELVSIACRQQARIITSTYNEPLITTEWSVEVFKHARRSGLLTSYVSNGNATEEVLDALDPWLDLYKVDLKAFRQPSYAAMGGVLRRVLDTIGSLHRRNKWIEVVTLVVPGMNDTDEELKDIAQFLRSVSADIPWHVTSYHEDYLMRTDEQWTPASTLLRAAEIGLAEGLHFVYTGNLPGKTKNFENTYCHSCKALLVERRGFAVLANRLNGGTCPSCGTEIPGRWA